MKRLFVLAFILLFLWGCDGGKEQNPQTQNPGVVNPKGWYVQASTEEQLSNGALLTYKPKANNIVAMWTLGENLLLMSQEETAKLIVLSGAWCIPSHEVQLPGDVKGVQVLNNAIAYYCSSTNEAVYLDWKLQEISRMKLPAQMNGTPVFAPDGCEIFYCCGVDVRGFDTTNGISRLIKSQSKFGINKYGI